MASWGSAERLRFFHDILGALKEVLPALPTPMKPPPSLSLSDRNVFKSELQAGGFAHVNVFTVSHIWTFPSPELVFNSLGSISPALARIFDHLRPTQHEAFRAALIRSIRGEMGDGPYGLEGEAHIAVGVK